MDQVRTKNNVYAERIACKITNVTIRKGIVLGICLFKEKNVEALPFIYVVVPEKSWENLKFLRHNINSIFYFNLEFTFHILGCLHLNLKTNENNSVFLP